MPTIMHVQMEQSSAVASPGLLNDCWQARLHTPHLPQRRNFQQPGNSLGHLLVSRSLETAFSSRNMPHS